MRGLGMLALVVTLCAACSEHALVRSEPPGAAFYVNDRHVGETPLEVTVPRSAFVKPIRFRLERAGYEPREGTLSTRVSPGRIVGGAFSMGISLIFRRPTTLRRSYDFMLTPQEPPEAAAR
ncbi:MAG TPA: PEGA domain-containing protein [Candidatus Binatia bacterium]|nr:PEGA domain-containing protein [Candidatus Binatia bacterium]